MTVITTTAIQQEIDRAYPASVDKFPLQGPDGMTTDLYGLFTDEGEHVGPAVKKGYEPHTRDDVAALMEAASIGFGSELEATFKCHWSGKGHYAIVSPSREYRRSIFGATDNVFPRAIVNARYGRSFEASLGLWRDLCDNLQMPSREGGRVVRFRHTHSLRANLDELVSDFQQLSTGYESLVEGCAQLEAQQHSVAEFIAELYPVAEDATNRSVTMARSRALKIVERIIHERAQTGRRGDLESASLWELVNGVTSYVQHDKSRKGERRTAVARSIAAINDPESIRAWSLATALAS